MRGGINTSMRMGQELRTLSVEELEEMLLFGVLYTLMCIIRNKFQMRSKHDSAVRALGRPSWR